MSLLTAELRKVWGNRVFPMLLAVLVTANLLLLWMGTRPTSNQPPAAAYRAVGADLAALGSDMAAKGDLLHSKLDEAESLLRLENYFRDSAYGNSVIQQNYREESVQTKAGQLAGISIFQNDETGYDLKNIEVTAAVYAGLGETAIDYYPQKGLYTAISYAFTDLILLASMLVLALLLVRQERDSGLLSLVRSLPAGRLHTALAKLGSFALSLLAVLVLLYGVYLAYCAATFDLGPLTRTIQSVPALMRCTMQITVGQYLFRFLLAKWAGAFVMGLWVMLAALVARRATAGWAAALVGPLVMFGIRATIPATSQLNAIKYANLASLLQTNELLGNYRNLYWFGDPIGLPLVEWTAAVLYGGALAFSFCWVFARAQLLSATKRGFLLGLRHNTCATSIIKEEARKLLLLNGAAVVLAVFIGFGVYQGVTAESYIGPDEIYYAYYMKHISGPFTPETYDWLEEQGEEFAPMLEVQQKVAAGELSSDAMLAFSSLQQKYSVYSQVINQNINYYLKEHGFTGQADVQDALLAGLACALCFSGLFSMERRGGMETILCTTPLGRKRTVRAKLLVSAVVAVGIAATSCLPHSGTAGLRFACDVCPGHEHFRI